VNPTAFDNRDRLGAAGASRFDQRIRHSPHWGVVKFGCAAPPAALLPKPFSPSNANQMLAGLAERGMIYKNRTGRYSFAVPLLGRFILRVYERPAG